MSRPRRVEPVTGVVQGRQVVCERCGRPADSKLETPDVVRPPLDLSRRTYLSVPQLQEYLDFPSAQATRQWLFRHKRRVPKCNRFGRRVLVLRRDVDEAVQTEDRKLSVAHASSHRKAG